VAVRVQLVIRRMLHHDQIRRARPPPAAAPLTQLEADQDLTH